MTNFANGRQAEAAAAEYLQQRSYKILEQNWRTRYCEIDIIAERKRTVYFVEVKYRRSMYQGTGLEYITAKKLEQMRFAAEMWVQTNHYRGDCELSGIEVSGETFDVTDFIERLT